MSLIKSVKIAPGLLLMTVYACASADVCPSPEIVRERGISREYEWTINERQTLEDVLAVEKLYSVRIKNKGEFVACYYYTSKQRPMRLDAKPLKANCSVTRYSDNWEAPDGLELVCRDDDVYQCRFAINM